MAATPEKCPLCGSSLSPYWARANMLRCSSCSLLVRVPRPQNEELEEFYSRSWSEPIAHVQGTGGTDAKLAVLFARLLAQRAGRASLSGMRLLDYGAGRGEMVRALADLGADVYAVEPFGYQHLVEGGLNAYRSVDELPPDLLFDGIVTIDVVEHLWEPWKELAGLRDRLTPLGWLYVATPNAGGVSGRVKGGAWAQAHNPGHLLLFSARSMEETLSRAGFARWHRLRWFVQYSRSPFKKALHFVLQTLLLDGELRYLAFRS